MLILASQSPRRRALLGEMGLDFTVRVSDADETPPAGASPEDAALAIARCKAEAVERSPDDVVIGADTTVLTPEGAVFGKPRDRMEAIRMLRGLSGRTHTVVTGVVVLRGDQVLERAVCTKVRFRTLTDEEIAAYAVTDEPYDKAGAYGIQGRAAWLVESIDGDFYNVVGLPLAPLGEMLAKIGYDVWQNGGSSCADSGNRA
ncbi:MAG: Maf family protein [Clostridiaceae bacterium]|nr:Maf family protein [Clostridiaceae bacterium]